MKYFDGNTYVDIPYWIKADKRLLKAIELECTLPCKIRDVCSAVDSNPTERDRLDAIHSYVKQILYPS